MTQLSNKQLSIVYANSKYYNSPARIIVLMQEQCNLLIEIARKYLDPASLFQVCITYTQYRLYGTHL